MDFAIKDAPMPNDDRDVTIIYCEYCGMDTNHVEINPYSGCFECGLCGPHSDIESD